MGHQGINGHRGRDATLGAAMIKPYYEWKNMEKEVEERRLLCIKLENGDTVPRPMGTQLIPGYANEVHMMDYILIWPSVTGRKYVLMQCDKLSKLVEFAYPDLRCDGNTCIQWYVELVLSVWDTRVVNF